MTGVFKRNIPTNTFLLIVYALAIKLPMLLFARPALESGSDGILYKALLGLLAPFGGHLAESLFAFALIVLQMLVLNRIALVLRLFPANNYLTGMSFVLATSVFSEWQVLSAPLVVTTLVILLFWYCCRLFNAPDPKTQILNVAMITGLMPLLYYPAGIFLILLLIGVLFFRPFRVNELAVALLGFFVPSYLLLSIIFLLGKWSSLQLPILGFSVPKVSISQWNIAAVIVLIIIVGLGAYLVSANLRRQVVHVRKCWNFLFFTLIIGLLIPFFNDDFSLVNWYTVAVPCAMLMAASFFYTKKKWVNLLLHWGLLALVVTSAYILAGVISIG